MKHYVVLLCSLPDILSKKSDLDFRIPNNQLSITIHT
jgi:hypothetical protein